MDAETNELIHASQSRCRDRVRSNFRPLARFGFDHQKMNAAASSSAWRSDFLDCPVSANTSLGTQVAVGPATGIHPEGVTGEGTVIGEICVLGHQGRGPVEPMAMGPYFKIRSHGLRYTASRSRLNTDHHVGIRENTIGGSKLRVGIFSEIEGIHTLGECLPQMHFRLTARPTFMVRATGGTESKT